MTEALMIQVPETTRELIDRLKLGFGVKTDAEVLSRALGLANAAVKVAGAGKTVTLSGEAADANVTVSLDK